MDGLLPLRNEHDAIFHLHIHLDLYSVCIYISKFA